MSRSTTPSSTATCAARATNGLVTDASRKARDCSPYRASTPEGVTNAAAALATGQSAIRSRAAIFVNLSRLVSQTMSQTVRGVISRAQGQPVELVDIVIPDPGPGEVVVDIQACGVCHTDLTYREGGINDEYPFLLGHEAAGVVESVGEVSPPSHPVTSSS